MVLHENFSNFEIYPPQDLSEARWDRNVFRNFHSRIRRRGFPFRGVVVHHEGIIPESFNKMVIFQERTRV